MSAFLAKVLFHSGLWERAKNRAWPCRKCGTRQVQITDARGGAGDRIISDWKCRECKYEWTQLT